MARLGSVITAEVSFKNFSLSIPPPNEKGQNTQKGRGSLSYLELWFVLPLWVLPKDWNLPLPCHKVVAINSLNLPCLPTGLGC